jgi:hypothetical protein
VAVEKHLGDLAETNDASVKAAQKDAEPVYTASSPAALLYNW